MIFNDANFLILFLTILLLSGDHIVLHDMAELLSPHIILYIGSDVMKKYIHIIRKYYIKNILEYLLHYRELFKR